MSNKIFDLVISNAYLRLYSNHLQLSWNIVMLTYLPCFIIGFVIIKTYLLTNSSNGVLQRLMNKGKQIKLTCNLCFSTTIEHSAQLKRWNSSKNDVDIKTQTTTLYIVNPTNLLIHFQNPIGYTTYSLPTTLCLPSFFPKTFRITKGNHLWSIQEFASL